MPASADGRWADAYQLVRAHSASLSVDLGYQNFDAELSSFRSMYSGRGGLWLAYPEKTPLGCVAVRELDHDTAELKRLFVLLAGPGMGLGRELTDAALATPGCASIHWVICARGGRYTEKSGLLR
jgi:hypothetical protein